MKTIGLIGGMSWESSAMYYQLMNTYTKNMLGGLHSSKSILLTVDFAEIEQLQRQGDWGTLNQLMVDAAKQLENAGADFIVLCTNTMHLTSPEIISNVSIPFLHIATATGEKIKTSGLQKIALLGTKFTMEKDFYKNTLQKDFGLDVIIPNETDREIVHDIIYQELVLGNIVDESRESLKKIIKTLENQGAQGVILGCTELPLLIKPEDVDTSVFDTTKIHAERAVELALKN